MQIINLYEFATRTFERLTDATEKFADGNILTKKDILLSIGKNPVLYEGKLQITPNEWLEPVRINAKSIRERLDKVRTLPEQMKKASEEAICLEWQGRWFLVKTFTDEDVNVSEIEDVLNSEDIDS